MRRRDFMMLLGSAAILPLAAGAQQRAMPVIGYLAPISAPSSPNSPDVVAFREGLGEFDYVEGRNLAIEYRWAGNNYDRLPAMAADLVVRKVDLIVTSGTPSTLAAKSATSAIPIIFNAGDPVRNGLVASLARPGGNLTGVSILTVELMPKRLELLSELAPRPG